jgi:hypothetical protein
MKAVPYVRLQCRQRGATAIEFALVAGVFLTLLLGIVEFSRLLFYWNTAGEATRLGARMAVVCDANAGIITNKMTGLLPILKPGNIELTYLPDGCGADPATARSSCESVTVSVSGVSVSTFIPFVPLNVSMPPFATTLSRESMNSATGGPVCS